MEEALRRWGAAGVALAVLLTGFMGVLSWRSAKKAAEDADWVAHAHAVMARLKTTLTDTVDVETGARGFVATGAEVFLEPYQAGQTAVRQDLETLRQQIGDPAQQQRMDVLERQINARIEGAKRKVAERQETGAIPAASVFLEGKRRMDAVRATVKEMESEESRLLDLRTAKMGEARRWTKIVTSASTLMGVVLLLLAGFRMGREINNSTRMRGQLRVLNANLEQRVEQRTAALRESEQKHRALFESMDEGFCTIEVLFDQNNKSVDYRFLEVNPAFEKQTGIANARGKSMREIVPGHEEYWFEIFGKVALTGEPARFENEAAQLHRWYDVHAFRVGEPQDRKVAIVFSDITERRTAEQEIHQLNHELEERVQQRTEQLRQSEQRVRRKLESILSPEGDLGNLDLVDMLDIPAVQSLVDSFYKLARIPVFFLDLKGNVLVSAGWQEVCTKFHRAHAEACRHCEESDRELSTGVAPGEFKLYKCKNNLWDVVTPILVGGQHVGNLFSGQFFLEDEPVDCALFRSQAGRYGFDEQEYLAALERVPRLSREAVDTGMAFYIKLAELLTQLGYSGIQLARSMTETGRANADLAASVKEMEAFTYSVSHDLRAPLRHISGFSKILSEEFGPSLPDEAQRHLQRIQHGTQRMGELVDDLLNLARVGRCELSLRPSGLKSAVDEVIAELAPEYVNRQIEWKIGDLPFVECDPGLMKQVFQNLILNALKFTRPRPRAVIEIGQTDEQGIRVMFVRDNGVGFNMKYADKLFGVFQRLHRAEDFEGTGVGLATVQRIVQKHGGRIWAEAELETGATFYFTLGASEKTEARSKAATAGDQV